MPGCAPSPLARLPLGEDVSYSVDLPEAVQANQNQNRLRRPPCPPLTRHLICMEKSRLSPARAGEPAAESLSRWAKRERRSIARAGARGSCEERRVRRLIQALN